MEAAIVSDTNPKPVADELTNGFVEPTNGVQEEVHVSQHISVNLDELSNCTTSNEIISDELQIEACNSSNVSNNSISMEAVPTELSQNVENVNLDELINCTSNNEIVSDELNSGTCNSDNVSNNSISMVAAPTELSQNAENFIGEISTTDAENGLSNDELTSLPESTDKPENTVNNLEAITDKPDDNDDTLEAITDKPDNNVDNLEAITDEPDNNVDNLEAITDEPDNNVDNLEAITDKPDNVNNLEAITEEIEENEIDVNDFPMKEEPELDDLDPKNTSALLGLTISNVVTLNAENKYQFIAPKAEDVVLCEPSKPPSIYVDATCKKIIKKVVKHSRSLTSPEYLWLILKLAPSCVKEKNEIQQVQQIVEKLVSEDSQKTIDELLQRVDKFTPAEYSALYKRLSNKRLREKPTECIKDFHQSIMWFKTHLEVDLEQSVNKSELFKSYNLYCTDHNVKPLKISEFISLLRSIYPTVREKRIDCKGTKRYTYMYSGVKTRTQLHSPKLPKYADDQLHNNLLISRYMSCHDCCTLYSSIVLNKTTGGGAQPKIRIKFQGNQSKSSMATTDEPLTKSLKMHDPLDLLNVALEVQSIPETQSEVIDLSQLEDDDTPSTSVGVAKKSTTLSRRIRKVPSKFREFTPTPKDIFPTILKAIAVPDKVPVPIATDDYSDKLYNIKSKIARFNIAKAEYGTRFKISCKCCNDVFFVTERHGLGLLSMQEKLKDYTFTRSKKRKIKRSYHISVKRLYRKYDHIVIPEDVLRKDIDPRLCINRLEIFDWYNNEISVLKRKLLDAALDALSTNSRRSRYELKTPVDSSSIDVTIPKQIIPSHPPIYISAVRETPKAQETHPKIAEVFIKAESSKGGSGRKRDSGETTEVVEIPAHKKSRSNHHSTINPIYSRNRHVPYNRRKESDFIYFPAIDTSPNNLRLANLGTLYKCILCLMLFNTEQKLFDHQKAHLFCHKCRRKFRDVHIMRIHLIKHCERNSRKRKPILQIHRVDSIQIMIKKYGESFEKSKAYYRELERPKPKRKYREMVRTKVEPFLPEVPVIEEIFINDVKPDITDLPIPTSKSSDYVALKLCLENNQQQVLQVMPSIPTVSSSSTIPVSNASSIGHYYQQESLISIDNNTRYVVVPTSVYGNMQPTIVNTFTEPPKLIPFPSTSSNSVRHSIKESTPAFKQKPFKIRVKDLTELS